ERTLDDCMNLFTDKHIRHLPVIDHGQLVGMITIGDVVKFLIKDQQNQIRDLEGYIAGSYIG
ncbi:MAG: CBS domain-containing protein, partial [Bacteroidetes bacterium]|nr:CBS domain-containing protein [Bacteroidota bacterium]